MDSNNLSPGSVVRLYLKLDQKFYCYSVINASCIYNTIALEGGPAKARDLSASSQLSLILRPAQMPDGPAKKQGRKAKMLILSFICLPPIRIWHKVNDPKVGL